MQVKARLRLIADHIPTAPRLVDVGCDHGKLGAVCLLEGKVQTLLATDLRQKPLERARHLYEELGLLEVVTFCQTYGLDRVDLAEGDVVVIAGMGGLEIRDILCRMGEEKRRLPQCWFFHPTRSADILRGTLSSLGYRIQEEWVIEEAYRYSPILHCRRVEQGGDGSLSKEEEFFGPRLLERWKAGEVALQAYFQQGYRSLGKRQQNPQAEPWIQETLSRYRDFFEEV